jgi:hypothetical protein
MDTSSAIILKMPYAVLLWRLSTIREVVLSGFQLELYSPTERPFAYWYASQVIDAYLHTLDMVIGLAPPGSLKLHPGCCSTHVYLNRFTGLPGDVLPAGVSDCHKRYVYGHVLRALFQHPSSHAQL